jgi:hypothetical protein
MAPKKPDSWRPCGDYRIPNARTIHDKYPVHHIHDFGNHLRGSIIFFTVELVKAYNQIPINKADIEKTAITTPFGLYKFPFMTFGLLSAGQTLQRFIEEVLPGFDFCFAYIDDILVFSKTQEDHFLHLRFLFKQLDEYEGMPASVVAGQRPLLLFLRSRVQVPPRCFLYYPGHGCLSVLICSD